MKVDSFGVTRMIIEPNNYSVHIGQRTVHNIFMKTEFVGTTCITIDPNNYPVSMERKTVYSIPIKLIEMKF